MTDHNPQSNIKGRSLKPEALVAVVMLLFLLVLSLVFYRERMLFIDAPHNLFLIINDSRFHIEEHRVGSFISQLLPFLGSKLHLPLWVLMLIYSAGFNLFFMAVGLLLVFRYRNYNLAILFGLYLTLFASATFYWPNNEVHQGMGWLMLAFATNLYIANNRPNAKLALPFFVAAFYLAIWTHPLIMLVAIYMWFFFWVGNINWPFSRRQSLIYTVILFVLAGIKFNTGMHHGYDSSKIESITHLQPELLKSIYRSPQLHSFLSHCTSNYWIVVLLFVAGVAVLVYRRKYLLAAMALAGSGGYLALLCITFWDASTTHTFYIESEYMPLTIMMCVPFVYFVLPMLKGRYTGVILLVVIFSIRAGYILRAAPAFKNRVVLLERINTKLKEKHISKAEITSLPHDADSVLIMNWGAPVESILLSGISVTEPQTTFIFQSLEEVKGFSTASKDTLLGCWEKRPYSRLSSTYFRLDTSSTYTVIPYAKLME